MPERQAPLPLTIISGYLGSGKTTLVNHLLRNANGRRLMVLVNDFGDLPIDADLIQSRDGDMINLSNGCACCSMGGDLFNALVDVLDQSPRPNHLLIEASGVADPARIANIALAEPDLKLDATISLVDTETLVDLLNDPLIGETVKQQLVASDFILLNKLDLVDQITRGRVEGLLDAINSNAKRLETEYSKVPIDLIIGIELADHQIIEGVSSPHDHADAYSKWSKTFDFPLDKNKLNLTLGQVDDDVLRLKGVVFFSDMEERHSVQCVGKRCTIAPIENDKNELVPAQPLQSRLVAIGLDGRLNVDKLDQLFANIEVRQF